jgi:hypothetical protein
MNTSNTFAHIGVLASPSKRLAFILTISSVTGRVNWSIAYRESCMRFCCQDSVKNGLSSTYFHGRPRRSKSSLHTCTTFESASLKVPWLLPARCAGLMVIHTKKKNLAQLLCHIGRYMRFRSLIEVFEDGLIPFSQREKIRVLCCTASSPRAALS